MNFKSCRQKTGAHIALTIVLSIAVSAMAPGRGRTFAEELQSRDVQLTKPALINALKSTDGEVRYLAAMKLAEDKAVEAVPAILDALAAETLPVTRTNIALALAHMGEERGFSTLEDTCAGRGVGAAQPDRFCRLPADARAGKQGLSECSFGHPAIGA